MHSSMNKEEDEHRLLLEQYCDMYDWSNFRKTCSCTCFKFILQLTLLATLGSFLFGYNVAVLNTAIASVNSELLMCGPRPSELDIAMKHYGAVDDSTFTKCQSYNKCNEKCIKRDPRRGPSGNTLVLACSTGFNFLHCRQVLIYNAFLKSAVLIGGAIGAFFGGRLMASGRRRLMLLTMWIFVLGTISSVCSNSFSALFWARLVVGFGVGLSSVATPTYISEVTPPAIRGKYGVFHQLFLTFGILVALLFGVCLTNPEAQLDTWVPSHFQRLWWRVMIGLGIVPAFIGIYLLIVVYSFETPVYYVEQRRFKDAHSLLQLIYGKEDVQRELESVIQHVRVAEDQKKNGLTFSKALANKEYRYVTIVGCSLAVGQQFGGINVFITSSNSLFKGSGWSGSMQTAMSIVMGIINVIMTFPTVLLIEKTGRRSLLLFGSTAQFLFLVPAAILYLMEPTGSKPSLKTQISAIIAVLGFVFSFAIAHGPILWVYLFEIYPMEIKDVAASIATMSNWIASIIMVLCAMLIPNKAAFCLFTVMQLLVTIFIFVFIRETKGLLLGESPYILKKSSKV